MCPLACELPKRQIMLEAVIGKWQVQSRRTGRWIKLLPNSNPYELHESQRVFPRRKRGGAILNKRVSKLNRRANHPGV